MGAFGKAIDRGNGLGISGMKGKAVFGVGSEKSLVGQ